MAETRAKDVSRWQGAYAETGEDIILVKISGGDDGLYYDSQAANNYNKTIAAGHAFGGYHFAGGTDPVAEANFFCNGMRPLLQGEVPCLDWEVQNPDPVGWCERFINQYEAAAGDTGGLIYMNLSTLRAYNWSRVLSRWGLWLADWNNNPEGDIDTGGIVYVMQQYNDAPGYDHDMFYGTKDQFKQYGFGFPTTPPVQPPVVTPPAPVVTTTTTTETKAVPFDKQTISTDAQEVGYSEVTQAGVDGVETIVTTITLTDGVETSRAVTSDTVTTPPVTEITTVGTKQVPTPAPNAGESVKKLILGAIAAIAAAIAGFLAWLHL